MLHFIIGTRAQLIKTAPLIVKCKELGVAYNFIYMAQHHQTIYEMIEMFDLAKPDFVIGDRETDITKAIDMTTWSIKTLWEGWRRRDEIFRQDKNGVAIVHGDAPPALLGALMAKSRRMPVAHVESGLRSFNYFHPFPEELTRVSLWKFRLVDYFFCQNEAALKNVERYRGEKFNTQFNTLVDALQLAIDKDFKEDLIIPNDAYSVVTLHRFETISKRKQLQAMVNILLRIAEKIRLLFILHPPTKVALEKSGLFDVLENHPNIELRPRYNYFEFISLIHDCEFLISDGGSNQEETSYMGKPCLLLRYVTERNEGVGKNVIISKFDNQIIDSFVDNYQSYECPRVEPDFSPSGFIVNKLAEQYAD